MSFLNFANKLRTLSQQLNNVLEAESFVIGSELMALIRNRVQERKENADNVAFGQYSQALVPQYYFYDKALTKSAEQSLKAGDWFVSYATFREYNGLDPNDINFTFTGEFFKTTGVTNVFNNNNGEIVVILGGQNERSANILEWQEPRYGNIIQASDSEVDFVVDAYTERVVRTINNII